MEDNIKKVFKIIGIQPNEPFFFKYGNDKNSYYINERLDIKSCKDESISEKYTIRDLLINPYSIEAKNSIKAKIETIFKFFVEIYGFDYLAKDKDGKTYIYTEKPMKIKYTWGSINLAKELNDEFIPEYLINYISTLVSWEDDEPLDMRKPAPWHLLV